MCVCVYGGVDSYIQLNTRTHLSKEPRKLAISCAFGGCNRVESLSKMVGLFVCFSLRDLIGFLRVGLSRLKYST